MDTHRLLRDKEFTAKAASPQPGHTLFDFLAQRLADSFTGLGCRKVLPSAPSLTADGTPTGMPSPAADGRLTAMPSQTPSAFGTHF
ncbi:hypothetical protein [Kitasatospora sp. NPDC097643]|uniref:hypothetical protein n=1 Tax=Kitasatospora sp. NPDC097643 TaxID=3157230 RepID=UPI0033181B98